MFKKILLALALVALGLFGRNAWPPRAHAQDFGSSVRPMGSLWNASAIGSANVFSVDLAPSPPDSLDRPSMMRVACAFKAPVTLYLVETANGVSQFVTINSGNQIGQQYGFAFVWPMRAHDEGGHAMTYNFQTSSSAGVICFRADELKGATD